MWEWYFACVFDVNLLDQRKDWDREKRKKRKIKKAIRYCSPELVNVALFEKNEFLKIGLTQTFLDGKIILDYSGGP